METITWLNKKGNIRTGVIESRGWFNVDRGEEFEVIPSNNPAVRVFLPVDSVAPWQISRKTQ